MTFAEMVLGALHDDEFCSCGHPVVELIPLFRTYQCRDCGRPIRAPRNNNTKENT